MNIEDKNYTRRRNWLLEQMKKTRWEDDNLEEKRCNRGRKPKPKPQPEIDMNKARNKHYNWFK